jgi:phosphatidylserine/phosphatidylglycerophosphate/cardiolipin synthase-like enzyme
MKAVAFSNNDMAVVAWTFGGKLPNCVGFAIYRIDVRAGTETCLPAMATFEGQDAKPNRTTADDPIQKFFWKDVFAKRGGTYRYRIVPMTGTPGNLTAMPYGPLLSNQVQLSPRYGVLSAYFNRGILATQATARVLHDGSHPGKPLDELKARIVKPGDTLRLDLAGEMITALTTLSDEAKQEGAEVHCALYEFQDPELLAHLEALGDGAHVILSNMPGGGGKGQPKTNDTYSEERQALHEACPDAIDRFMPSNAIGHNKFQVLDKGGAAQAVLFGSTNWTSNALCAQTNNSIIARSPKLAQAYLDYWNRLRDDTRPPGENGRAQQGSALRDADATQASEIALEDGSGTVRLWFSPNTPHARSSKPKASEDPPPDLAEVFDAIAKAQQAVVFLAFEPGRPSIIDAIADALKAKPTLFVRGAVTARDASGEFYIGIHGAGAGTTKPPKHQSGDPPLPQDYRVIAAQGVNAKDAFGQWEAELNSAGHAVIHDKIVVIDPFSDDCVVVTGSHNLGYKASYNNDENMAIIRNHRALAEAYAAHCLDVYDHYAWRYHLATDADQAWHFLQANDKWQDSYYDGNNQVKSAELTFWLGAIPMADALPTPNEDASTRVRPELQRQTNGVSPAVGPHSAAATPAAGRKRQASRPKPAPKPRRRSRAA